MSVPILQHLPMSLEVQHSFTRALQPIIPLLKVVIVTNPCRKDSRCTCILYLNHITQLMYSYKSQIILVLLLNSM